MKVDIRSAGSGVLIRCHGDATEEGVSYAVDELAAFENFAADTPTLWDFSRARGGSLLADQMRSLGARVSTLRSGADRPRVGLLMGSEADFGGARMFVGLNEARLPSDFRIFLDGEEAFSWTLGVSLSDVGAER